MPASHNLTATKLGPLGVRVQNLDVRCQEQLDRVRQLLWENGVIVIPAHSAATGAPPIHEDASLVILASLYGEIEPNHPVNKNKGATQVQILQTRGNSGIPADSFLFHSDMSWRVNPSIASVLCGAQIPSKGGDTQFRSSHLMYKNLSPELKDAIHNLSFKHSLNEGYSRVNRPDDVKVEQTSIQPAVITHPATGAPLLYINENFTVSCEELDDEECSTLLKRVFNEAYRPDNLLNHSWTQYDVVIWDNLGVQHLAKDDYDELRTMHRVVAENPYLRLERYTGHRAEDESLHSVYKLLDRKDNKEAYDEYAYQYDQSINACGYRMPQIATRVLGEEIEKRGLDKSSKILDLAAGTGRVALLLMQNYKLVEIDAMDVSEGMLKEARRRELYRHYHIGDANNKFGIDSDIYDVSMCIGGLAPNQIEACPAIEEMVRIVKKPGLVLISMQSRNRGYMDEVERLVAKQQVKVVRNETATGITSLPHIEHNIVVLEVC